MNEEDEAFEAVRRQSGWRKRQIEDRQEEAMRRDEVIEIARRLGWNVEHEATNSMLRRFAEEVVRRYKEKNNGEQPEERNFCPRCGKRAGKNDWDVHTCSPPEEKHK